MKERFKWPLTALILAAVGAGIRIWQTSTAFEGELGLSIPNAPASWAMAAFYVLSALVFIVLARTTRSEDVTQRRLSQWDIAFAAPQDVVHLALITLGALLTLLSAIFLFQEAAQMSAIRAETGRGDSPLLQIVLALCALPGGLGLAVSAGISYRATGRGRENGALLLPLLLNCVWLLEAYRTNAADPVLWDYVPLLLTVAMALLFQMESAGMAFTSKGHPRWLLWLAGMTAAVSGTALGGPLRPGMLLLAGGEALCALGALWTLPGNLSHPPADSVFGPQAKWAAEDVLPTMQEKEEDTNG